MKKKSFFSFGLVIIFLVLGFFLINSSGYLISSPLSLTRRGVGERSEDIKSVQIAGQNIKVDLALDSVTQAQGLSGRSGLAENSGMLFIFEHPGKYYFWMQGMNFHIDMIWISEDLKVIYIKKNATPESYMSDGEAGPETYGPDINTKYVLEVASGFSDKNNLKEGDRVEFTY